MAEYIEREALYKALTIAAVNDDIKNRCTWIEAACVLYDLPAADVVPVVRCKDCKHHYDCGVHFCDRLGMDCPDDSDFFCSCGERKDGDDDAEPEE